MRNNESRNMKGIRRLMAGCPLSIVGSLFLLAACSGEEESPGTLAPQGATRVEFRARHPWRHHRRGDDHQGGG